MSNIFNCLCGSEFVWIYHEDDGPPLNVEPSGRCALDVKREKVALPHLGLELECLILELTISPVTRDDAGFYFLVAWNDTGYESGQKIRLNVISARCLLFCSLTIDSYAILILFEDIQK